MEQRCHARVVGRRYAGGRVGVGRRRGDACEANALALGRDASSSRGAPVTRSPSAIPPPAPCCCAARRRCTSSAEKAHRKVLQKCLWLQLSNSDPLIPSPPQPGATPAPGGAGGFFGATPVVGATPSMGGMMDMQTPIHGGMARSPPCETAPAPPLPSAASARLVPALTPAEPRKFPACRSPR